MISEKEKQTKANIIKLASTRMNFILSRLIDIRDSEIKKMIKTLITNNKNNLLMNDKRIDEIFFAKNKIPKIEKMHLKINKISEKVHIFNPLSTKKKKCNNLYINNDIKCNLTPKNANNIFFLTTASSLAA